MAYGTSAGVAALRPMYAASGEYTTATNPTKATVDNLLTQVSSMLDSVLSAAGFAVPVTDTDVVNICTMFVEAEVSDLVDGIRGLGKFGPDKKTGATSKFTLITDDVQAFVKTNRAGFERMGATIEHTAASSVLTRDTDEQGDETFPIFQRKGFGNRFTNWDSNDS